jgi:fumarate reductase subunit D
MIFFVKKERGEKLMEEEIKQTNVAEEGKDVKEGKVWAILAYLGILCLLPLLLKKENKFALHHAKQGLVLFIGWLIAIFINIIPIIGQVIFLIFMLTYGIYAIIGIIQSLMGKYWKAPIISKWAEKISI